MKQQLISLFCGGAVLVTLGGCTTAGPALEGRLDPNLGAAVRTNVQAQAVAPTAQQKANTYIPSDPSRAALALQNYRDGKVKEPVPVNPSGN